MIRTYNIPIPGEHQYRDHVIANFGKEDMPAVVHAARIQGDELTYELVYLLEGLDPDMQQKTLLVQGIEPDFIRAFKPKERRSGFWHWQQISAAAHKHADAVEAQLHKAHEDIAEHQATIKGLIRQTEELIEQMSRLRARTEHP